MEQGLLGRGARKLADIVDYQAASVVSRTLIKKGTGTVTLFAFDEGEGLSEHSAPFDALLLAADGEADVTIAGNAVRVREGDVILLPATEPHAVKAVTRFKMLLTMIRS